MSLTGVILHVYILFSYPANVMKLQVLKIWLLKKTFVIRYRDCGTMGVTHSVYRFPTFIQHWMKLSFCLLNVSVLETFWNHRSQEISWFYK